jgi:hypothetical protein
MTATNGEGKEARCLMCDSSNVMYWYPGPLCPTCHREWSE